MIHSYLIQHLYAILSQTLHCSHDRRWALDRGSSCAVPLVCLAVSSAQRTSRLRDSQSTMDNRLDLLILVVRKATFHLDMTVT